jgi:hypothetical protein
MIKAWIPEDALYRGDADVSLFFLSADDIIYYSKINDDLYAAHTIGGETFTTNGTLNITEAYYISDEPVTVLGCTNQGQFCVPSLSHGRKCSRLGGSSMDWEILADSLQLDNRRSRLSRWLLDAVVGVSPGFTDLIFSLRSESLVSRSKLFAGASTALPDNQWQMDVE